ncbi:uncharacterized protein B0T15DRAFT_155832 [Chaetomium strumarium]|uniref:Uncharacterized protein n=1 Tax=Chaetomium strumarium TaxID=1170767 RepID=A0AAJ0M2P7_9PEZI|nr:hypothetical protein B0T15DRAFT_155832 [Chaetomium strumarium]
MNFQSRSTSLSTLSTPQALRRPSVGSRLSSAVSIAERGENQDGGGIAAQHQIEEEIAKIKRYEDFTTIGCCAGAAAEKSKEETASRSLRRRPIRLETEDMGGIRCRPGLDRCNHHWRRDWAERCLPQHHHRVAI